MEEKQIQFSKEVVERYGENIYHYALKLTAHPQDAKDVVQDTFLQAWLHYDDLKEKEATLAWLKTICFRTFLHWAKKKNLPTESAQSMEQLLEEYNVDVSDNKPDIATEVIVEEDIKAMQNGCFLAMVRKLTLEQRIAFSLSDMFGLEIERVAQLLGVNKNAAKSLLHRARMNMDSFFAGHCNLLSEENTCSCKAWIVFWSEREQLQKTVEIKMKEKIKEQERIEEQEKIKEIEKTTGNETFVKDKLMQENQLLNYKEKQYVFDETIRQKIYYLYRNMPDQKPEKDWYQNLIHQLFLD